MDPLQFESIIPSRYISFTLPIPNHPTLKLYLQTERFRIAILDSPSHPPNDDPPAVGVILVPRFREPDWVYSTEAGLFQLLSSSPKYSRMILVGNDPYERNPGFYTRPEGNEEDLITKIEGCLHSLLVHFVPKRTPNRELNSSKITYLRFEDNVVSSMVLDRLIGPVVGEFIVEDVLIEGPEKEFRRKLRFKRTPYLVQSEIKIVPTDTGFIPWTSLSLGNVKFRPDLRALVHIYLAPMVASLSLASAYFQYLIDSNNKPKVLCLGVGGGALLGFLATQLGFRVLGLEADSVVLDAAMKYFGLKECDSVRANVGDGIEFLKAYGTHCNDLGIRDEFHAIMVDLDPGDFRKDTSVPPVEFMQKTVLSAAKASLSLSGLLVLNVIPEDQLAYDNMILMLREVFVELYQIDLGKGEHFVVVATMSRIDISARVHDDAFLTKLRSATSSALIDSIQKI